MARTKNSRAASGAGSIRQRSDGTWEARFVVGHDPGTGKPIRKSVYAKTQKDVRQKLAQAVAAVDNKAYIEPCKMTLGEWLDIRSDTYLEGVKPRTVKIYKDDIRLHIKPYLAAVKLDELDTHTVQKYFNTLLKSGKKVPKKDKDGNTVKKDGKTVYEGAPLSAKTVKNVHGVLHGALRQAVINRYIPLNPADGDFCKLPKAKKQEIKPLDETQIAEFLKAIRGNDYEDIFIVTLFTGMREGEVMGLTWDCVDFENGILTVNGTSYVVADNFNSWYITGGAAAADMKADTLTVDKTSTVTDLGITLASGDYVVMVEDSDGYITDLYLFNAAE